MSGPPDWYTSNSPAGDPIGNCVGGGPETWQSFGKAEYPSPVCSWLVATQIVLEKTKGPHLFVARVNLYGMTVDAAHKRDGDAADSIRQAQPSRGDEG